MQPYFLSGVGATSQLLGDLGYRAVRDRDEDYVDRVEVVDAQLVSAGPPPMGLRIEVSKRVVKRCSCSSFAYKP